MGGREPTEEQWRAISWPLEPFVLVAGAGSGKTSVMAARVVYLALAASGKLDGDAPGVLPGNVLCLTFTNKATENLQQRIRHALAGLQLAEGEEPEIMNYHGFAAQLLSRYGMLAGIEPDQRVLSPAQRTELCARVMDLMTFEHVKTENQGGVIDNILLLDDQASNHRRTPEEIIAFNEARLEQLQEHRSDRAYRSSLERIELARGAAIFRQLKRDLGAIDFGDQISLALKVVEEHPQVAVEYRQRFGAVLLDEYQDTDVAQAKLIAGVFGEGHPGDGRGRPRPEHLRVAWRQPVQPVGLPGAVPPRRRVAVRAAAALHELPLGGVDPGSRRRRDLEAPRSAAAGSRQAAGPVARERHGRGARGADLGRVARGGVDRRAHPRAARGRSEVVRRRRALPLEPAVLLAAAGVRGTGDPRGDPGARRAPAAPRDRRGPGVRPRGQRPARERGAREDPARPPLPRRVQGPRACGGARQDEELRAPPGGRGGGRGDAVPVRRGARAPRPGRAALGRSARAARGVPA